MNRTSRLSPGELERKKRYIENEFRERRYPLNRIIGLNVRDRAILEQHIRTLETLSRRRHAGYKQTLGRRRPIGKSRKSKKRHRA